MLDTTLDHNFNFNNFVAAGEVNEDPYSLNIARNTDNVGYFQGSLEADIFAIDSSYDIAVISGNGNVDFGSRLFDTIALSDISVDEIVNLNLADTAGGGVALDPGNGERIFDHMTLADGTEIYFEGIDRLSFADGSQDLAITPNDPGFESQWNLHMMGVHNAWRFTTGSDDVLIGVQDSGVGVDESGNLHEDFRAEETWFYDAGNLGLLGNLADDFSIGVGANSQVQSISHGTSVHGIIAANADNGQGIAGINWNSDVYNIDVLDNNTGDLTPIEATQEMIDEANSRGQNLVINMSFGIDTFGTLHESYAELEQLVANNPNTLFTIATSNQGHLGIEGLSSPDILAQDYDNVMAIGASWGKSDRDGNPTAPGTRIEYADWGSGYGEGLTVMGPSEVPTTNANANGEFNYDLFNGTSAAAPNVSGVASLVWSANSNLTAAEVNQIISETAYDLGAEDYDVFYGHGMVNADAAVRRAMAIARSEGAVTV